MKARILALLEGLEPRMLFMLGGCILAFGLLEGWLLVLRQPLADYRRLQDERAALTRPQANVAAQRADFERLERELAAFTGQLQGEGPQPAADQLVVYLIERLDRIAARHGVRLDSVRPGATRSVLMFDEVSSDIKVTGKYAALFDWLREAERELGPLVVTQFTLKIADVASGVLSMELKLAAYRPAAPGSAKK